MLRRFEQLAACLEFHPAAQSMAPNHTKLRLRFSYRGLLLLFLLIALTSPCVTEWYEMVVLQQSLVPTNHKNFQKLSPFTSVSFKHDRVDVSVNGSSYELLAINEVGVDRLLRLAALAFGSGREQKRFVEDLLAVLNAAGMDRNEGNGRHHAAGPAQRRDTQPRRCADDARESVNGLRDALRSTGRQDPSESG